MTTDSGDFLAHQVGDAEVVREVFDALGLIVAGYAGPELRVVAANAALRAFAARQDLVGRPLRELFPEFEGQQIVAVAERVYATGEQQAGREWRVQVGQDGPGRARELFIDFVVDPYRDANGTVQGVIGYAIDVTSRVRERQAAEREAAEAERRYTAARDVVAALQEALLPTALPVLPRVRIAARYLVAAADQAAGGDWFDAVPLPGGSVALVVGDVVGHGVAASAAMGQLRAVLRHELTVQPDLAAALAQADGFATADPALSAATVCVAVLDPVAGTVRYSACGHPPPLVIARDGTARFLPPTGSGPLGTGTPPVLGSAVLGPAEVILLYSDGLVERPGRTLDEGMADLAVVAGDAAADRVLPVGPAATAAERVCQLTVELLTRGGYTDDVTTLAAQRLPAPPAPLDAELPAHPGAVITLRRALDDWLAGLGVATKDRQVVELAVTEVVTNAVEHAYPPGRERGPRGPVRLEASLGEDGYLQARVSDRGQWRSPTLAESDRGRGLMLARQLAGELTVTHPPQDASEPPGARGTIVTLRHRLHRPAMLATRADGLSVAREEPPFTAELLAAGPVPCLRLAGPADITTADRLTGELLTASRGGMLSLTADLTSLTILASAGIRALHEVRDQLITHGQQLTLVAAPGSLAAGVLDLVRLPHLPAPNASSAAKDA